MESMFILVPISIILAFVIGYFFGGRAKTASSTTSKVRRTVF